ncbi:MAG: hypothetical protein KAI53_00720 [Candidatus Aenigmarchaeota archaeon]|nr:hypothetical protein [Candidatus Aenigmarchaeota archaeon]
MDIACEMALVKSDLRKQGLSTKGIFMQDYRKGSVSDEIKWCRAKKRARARIEELANIFPYAFGTYAQERYAKDFLEQYAKS